MAKLTAEEKIGRAKKAELLLQDPLLVEAFAEIKGRIFDMWSRSDRSLGAQPEREWLFHQHVAISVVEGYLTRVVRGGSLELQTAAQTDGHTERGSAPEPER